MPLRGSAAPNGTCLGTERCAADGVGDDRLEQVARLLPGPVVDVEEPFPPEEQAGRGRTDRAELQQPARTDLLDRRYGLRLQNPFVLQPSLVEVRQACEERVCVALQADEPFHEREELNIRQTHGTESRRSKKGGKSAGSSGNRLATPKSCAIMPTR